MSEKSGCTTCSRVLLIIIDLILLVGGLALVAFAVWFRYKDSIEAPLKNAIADQNPTPYEMWDLKYQFRSVAMLAFWAVVGLGAVIAIAALVGVCGSCALSRCWNGFYTVVILLLITAEVAAAALIIIYRSTILDRIHRYIGVAFQYNMQDSLVVRDRFRCCGDGTFNSYNYVCQGIPLPNCRDAIDSTMNFVALIGGAFFAILVGIEVLTIIFSCVIIMHRNRLETAA